MLSLEKTLQVPHSEVARPLSSLDCLNLVSFKVYKNKYGQIFPIKIDEENLLHFMLHGMVHSSASEGSYCSGSRVKTDTSFMASGFQLIKLKIINKPVTIISEPKKRLIVQEDNTYLPSTCHVHDLVCHASHGIFVWPHNNILKCKFQYIRQSTMEIIEDSRMIARKNKILLTTPSDPIMIECFYPHRIIMKTSEGVWYTSNLSHNNKCLQFSSLKCKEIYEKLETPSLHDIFQVSVNYILYHTTAQLLNNHIDITNNHCQLSNRLSGDLIHVSQNIFFRSLGDVLAILTCRIEK